MHFAEVQNLIALGAVLLAVGYLTRAGCRVLEGPKKPGCGACGSCPASHAQDSSAPANLVSLDSLRASAPRR